MLQLQLSAMPCTRKSKGTGAFGATVRIRSGLELSPGSHVSDGTDSAWRECMLDHLPKVQSTLVNKHE